MVPFEEREIYKQALPSLPLDLIHMIYEATEPEEVGTPRKKCARSTMGAATSGVSECKRNVDELISDYFKFLPYGGIPFNRVGCAIYCLFNNLPTHTNIVKKEYDDDAEEVMEGVMEEVIETHNNFEMSVDIHENAIDRLLFAKVAYNDTTKKHAVTIQTRKDVEPTTWSLDDLIDLIFYYGDKKTITFHIDEFGDQNSIYSFEYADGIEQLWTEVENEMGNEFNTVPLEVPFHY